MSRTIQDYTVILNVISQVRYVVPAVSPEEAEVIAETYLEEREPPADVQIEEVQVQDVYPEEGSEEQREGRLDSLADSTGYSEEY